jgi:GT2 family glycosyltransferase
MKSNKAAIIIVNWNGKKFLKNCLNSVYKQTYKNFQVYFVDNGSIDNSSDYIKKNFSKTKIIQLNKNYGFAKPNNIGIKEAFKDKQVKYIVCLNNDTIVNKNWLKELIKTAEKDKEIGMVSSKAYFPEGRIQNAGLCLERALQINKPGGISLGYGLKDEEILELNKEIEIFAPGGVAPLYKRKMLEELYNLSKEYFDEDFFAYAEDLDLGFRGRLLGYKAILSPNSKLIHFHSQTGKVASPLKAYYTERNIILTVIKDFLILNLLKFQYYNLTLKIDYSLKRNESIERLYSKRGFLGILWIMLKVYLSVLYYLPKMLMKRWRIQKNKKVLKQEINNWFKKFSKENN